MVSSQTNSRKSSVLSQIPLLSEKKPCIDPLPSAPLHKLYMLLCLLHVCVCVCGMCTPIQGSGQRRGGRRGCLHLHATHPDIWTCAVESLEAMLHIEVYVEEQEVTVGVGSTEGLTSN